MNKSAVMVFMLVIFFLVAISSPLSAQESNPVYVIPIKGMIDPGTQVFVSRAYEEAAEQNAAAILLEIDTPGGWVFSAVEIRNIIHKSEVPTIAFVEEGAISAGALIALVSETLVMAPGSTMGAAEPQQGGERADAKTLSYWVAQLEAAAEETGRDPRVARAMADVEYELEGVSEKGSLLTLTPQRALELGMIDQILPNRQQVLDYYEFTANPIVELEPAFGELIIRWVTHPTVSTILLTVGIAGLVLEIFTVGFGIAGTIGLASLGMYFAGHMIAGMSGFEAILLFILGLLLLAVEVIVMPGFGLPGIAGVIALIAGIIIAAPSVNHGVTSLVIAFLTAGVLLAVSVRFLPTRKLWKRLVLGDRQVSEEGYNAPTVTLRDLLGEEGVSLTPLRPSGTAKFGEQRIDVVTQGSFITKDTKVKVVKVEGTRVIVEKILEVD